MKVIRTKRKSLLLYPQTGPRSYSELEREDGELADYDIDFQARLYDEPVDEKQTEA